MTIISAGNMRLTSALKCMFSIGILATMVAGLLNVYGTSPAKAEDRFGDEDHGRISNWVKSGKLKSLTSILKTARRRVKGRVAGVSLISRSGELVYRVKILKKNGRLVNVYINAGSRTRDTASRKSDSRRGGSDRHGRSNRRSDRDDDDDDDRHDRSRNDDEKSGDRDEDSSGRGRGEDRHGRDH